LVRCSLVEGRKSRGLAIENCATVCSAQVPLQMQMLKITPDGRFRNLNTPRQIRQTGESALPDKLEHFVATFLDQHY